MVDVGFCHWLHMNIFLLKRKRSSTQFLDHDCFVGLVLRSDIPCAKGKVTWQKEAKVHFYSMLAGTP